MHNLPDSPSQRYQLLEALLLWEGRLKNSRVRDVFGISQISASVWIRDYREAYPNNTRWDTKQRAYVAEPSLYLTKRNLKEQKQSEIASLARYIDLVGIPHYSSGSVDGRAIWSAFPDLSVPTPKIFAILSSAIHSKEKLDISYSSMREPKPHGHTIVPHSLVRAGRRWHVRAYSESHHDFRDFALGRIVTVDGKGAASDESSWGTHDVAWHTPISVHLIAHPLLSQDQQQLIRFEYFNDNASRIETCRAALLGYFVQDIRAAIDTEKQRPPDYQLAVYNVEDIKQWLFSG